MKKLLNIFFLVLLIPTLAFSQDENEDEEVEISDREIILFELQGLRADISMMLDDTSEEFENSIARLNDRLGAFDQRMLSLEDRIARINRSSGDIENRISIALSIMAALAILVAALVVIQRKKHLDPVHLHLASIEARLSDANPEKIEGLIKTLKGLAKNDPRISQLLNQYGLGDKS